MIDLKGLVTFVEVSKRLSFAQAARALRVPASTVTTRINALEAELGVRLFNRSTRKTALTHEGSDFAKHCIRALEEIEFGREKLLSVSETTGLVRVSLPSAFPKAEFAALIAEFRADYPEVSVDVIFEDRLTDFIEDSVDLALRGHAPGSDDLFARKLASTPVLFVVPSDTKASDKLPILSPLGKMNADTSLKNGVTTKSMEFALELVIAGQARAYLPQAMCEAALSCGKVITIDGPLGTLKPLELFLVYHDKRYQPRRVTLLKDFLIDRLAG